MSKTKDLIADLIAFEEGEMTEHEQVGFLAHLYNIGVLRSLQGYFQRAFAEMVDGGDIVFVDDKAVTRW